MAAFPAEAAGGNSAAAPAVSELRRVLREPEAADRPMMRWWWFGPDVEHAEIDRELRAMADAGLGGAEVAFVHPLRETDDRFGSERMLTALRHAAETARALGMRLDVTLGSGWSFGGPHIGPEHASRRLRWERREISPEPMDIPIRPAWPGDHLVGAYLAEGLPATGWRRLAVEGAAGAGSDEGADGPDGGMLSIPAGRGPRSVLLAWSEVTGQQVKRAAAGAEGPVLDHFSQEATRHHLAVVGEALLGAVPAGLIGSVFCDSLEVYEAGWTPRLPEEFRARRGYDLLDVLHRLVTDEEGTAQLRIDLGRTLSELAEENFVAVCRDWAAARGVPFRLQSYGEPPVTLSSYRSVDLVEGEGAGWAGITPCRWASSAAHLLGRDVVSSELWTWVHSPSFRATPLDLAAEAHDHLLQGITRIVGHGWPYSPPDAPGLGWRFYAAGALDDRNPWWPAMRELTGSIARLCGLLRRGDPVNDVLLYLPYDDVRAEHPGGFDLFRACRDRIGPEIPAAIRTQGLDFDLVDDEALQMLDPAQVAVLVIARTTRLPETTRERVDAVRRAGGSVIGVDSPALPAAERTAAEDFAQALRRVIGPELVLEGDGGEIGVLHRRLADGDLHLLANTGAQVRHLRATPRTPRSRLEIWDPADGTITTAPVLAAPDGRSGTVPLVLHPYQALVLVGSDEESASAAGGAAAEEDEEDLARIDLDGTWTFTAGGTAAPAGAPAAPAGTPRGSAPSEVGLPHSWEGLLPPECSRASYEIRVQILPEHLRAGTRIELDLGPCTPMPRPDGANGFRAEVSPPVGEIAVVEVDGEEAGIIWDAPHRLDLTGHAHAGENLLRLTVLTTAAGAAAVDPHVEPMLEESRRHYGERFALQDLDRALEGVRRGLHTVPVLRVRRSRT